MYLTIFYLKEVLKSLCYYPGMSFYSYLLFLFQPLLYASRREMFFDRYGRLLMDKIIGREQVYGVPSLRHLCR